MSLKTCEFGGEYIIGDDESKRINIIKFISIIFVVYIHSHADGVNFADNTFSLDLPNSYRYFMYIVQNILARFAVPCFFLLSFVLLFKKTRNYTVTLKNKVKTLLVPYLFWNTFWILALFFLQSFSFTSVFFSGNNTLIRDCNFIDWLHLYGIGAIYPQDYPLWFMRDLMVVVIISPIVWTLVNKLPKIFLILSLVSIIFPFSFPFKTAIEFAFLGACIVKYNFHMTDLDRIPFIYFLIGFIGVNSIAFVLYLHDYSFNGLLNVLNILFWIRFSKEIVKTVNVQKVMLWLSESAFMIYAAHELTMSSVGKLITKIIPLSNVGSLLKFIFLPLAIIALCIIADKICKRILPRFHSIITGER